MKNGFARTKHEFRFMLHFCVFVFHVALFYIFISVRPFLFSLIQFYLSSFSRNCMMRVRSELI